jgi:hypothetical protein
MRHGQWIRAFLPLISIQFRYPSIIRHIDSVIGPAAAWPTKRLLQ